MREGALHPGNPDAPPSIDVLPDPDVVDEALTEHMRFGRRLANEALSIQAPPPPADHSAEALTRWTGGALRTWLERVSHAAEEAHHELDLAAEESHRQRIMAGAIVGLVYEFVGRALAAVPTPDDLRDEPEIADIFRQTVLGEAAPYLETARRAYHACERNGVEPATMRHWAAFCSGRLDYLPAPAGTSGDETVVEIIAD